MSTSKDGGKDGGPLPGGSAKQVDGPDRHADAAPGSLSNPAAAESSISTTGLDPKKRRTLVRGAAAVGGLATVALAWPLVASMLPSARARAAGAPVIVDIGQLAPGQLLTVEWRGKPVWVVNRTEGQLARLTSDDVRLSDPGSAVSLQPAYAVNDVRSIKPEYLVVVGVCTHLGCSPTYRPDVAPADLGSDWDGGFFCPCHGSRFDLAGRVYAGVPAPTNLEIPPYRYETDSVVVIGEDSDITEVAA